MSITYTIDFAAALARLEEGTARGSRAVRKMADEMEAASNFAKNALATIGIGLSGAAFAAGVKSAAEAADAAAKMGDRFGIATEQMIGMQHAANLAGVSNEGLTTALRGLAKSGIEAAQGNEAARVAFERLHLSASEFIKLPMDQQLSIVIDRLGKMENAAVRNATAQAVMGRNAGEMMGLVAEGSDAFRKAAEDAEAWGLALNRIDAAKIEMANDAIKRAEAATRGVFTQIALALSPAVIALANHFADTKAEARGYREEISSGSEIIIQAIGYAMNFVQGLRFAWVAAKLAVAEFADFTVNAIAGVLSWIPGSWAEQMRLLGESTTQTAADIKAELDSIAAEGLPADEIIARIRKVQATLDDDAKKTAARRQALNKEGGDPGIVKFDSYTAALAQQLGALIEHNRNELAVVQAHYDQKQALLDESVAKGFITDDFWQGQSMLLFQQYQDAKARAVFNEFELQRQKNQAVVNMERATWQLGAEFLQTFAGKSRIAAIAVIAINKALAISQTISATAAGVMRAFSDLGPVAGAVAAAEIESLGAIQVGLIAATGIGQALSVPGGGASVGSIANPVITAPSFPAPAFGAGGGSGQSPVEIHVHVETHGNIIGQDGIRQLVNDEIIPAFRDAIGSSDVTIIDVNSRQAAILAPV